MKSIERIFEGALWNSRLVVLFAVVASLAAGIAVFFMATVDTWYLIMHLVHYASPSMEAAARKALHDATIGHVVEVVDGYLLATVLLIFSLGLYELFISKIDQAKESESSENVLLIRNLDDLKMRLAKVILMILIVKFFELVLAVSFKSPLDLLYLAAGIALIGVALYLSHSDGHVKHK